jgi:hypothetical protein
MKRWYVVHTQTYQEGRAELNLRRQGFEAWLPLFRRARGHARRITPCWHRSFPAIFSFDWISPSAMARDQRHFGGCPLVVQRRHAARGARGAGGRDHATTR